jgi:hypothetical protein
MSTAPADPTDPPPGGGHRFSVVEAAAASGVSRRTIQRALPQLMTHGAERVGSAWAIPYAALVAAGFQPGKASAHTAQSPSPHTAHEGDTSMRATSAPLGSRLLDPTELAVELATLRVQLEAAQQRSADLARQLDRAYAEADNWRVMATHQLVEGTRTPSVPDTPAAHPADAPAHPADTPREAVPAESSPQVTTATETPAPRRRWWQLRT